MKKKNGNIKTTREYWERNLTLKERQIWLQVIAILGIATNILLYLTS